MNIDIILKFIDKHYKKFKNQGFADPGHNGPYLDSETPARNTAHWILIFSYAYKKTKNEKFKDIIYEFSKYLLNNDEIRPYGFTYLCRNKEGKDKCNGLIGNAWIIEGLVEAYNILNDEKIIILAKNIIMMHKFNYKNGFFYRCEIDGNIMSPDSTFNHQLWFIMAVYLVGSILTHDKLLESVDIFFSNINNNLGIHKNGRIIHSIIYKKSFIKYIVNKINNKLKKNTKINPVTREIGYHSFNTFAFARLKEAGYETVFWKSEKFNKILDFLDCAEYTDNIESNKFGYCYNPPGYEVLYTKEVFNRKITNFDKKLYNTQFEKYLLNDNLAEVGVMDIPTQKARFYESVFLKGKNYKNI